MDLGQYARYHFIGIGGISMSGLAQMLRRRGHEVTGSDRSESAMLGKLRAEGIVCYVGHAAHQVEGADAIVYTAAVPKDNCELLRARELGIPCIYRGDLLGAWMADYGTRIGICGTHGKSTCTAMTATILVEAGIDPSIHCGSELGLLAGTTRLGRSEVFVTEACEYQDSFLDLFPTAAVVLNIEEDHLDYFSGIDQINDSFARFIELCPADGVAILNGEDTNCRRVAALAQRRTVTFGMTPGCDYRAVEASLADGCWGFTLELRGEKIARVQLSVPGHHNIYNALAAIASCALCGVEESRACELISRYHGTERRFTPAGKCRGAQIVHDYAHHPTEIRATLSSARDVARGEVWAVFQPHTYTRTRALFDAFVTAFEAADHLLVADIYAAREKDPGDIHASMVADKAAALGHPDARYGGAMDAIADTLRAEVRENDLILVLGAGDIIRLVDKIREE